MITLRTLTVDEWAGWRDVRLAALREAPAAFGSSLASWQGDGDREQRWRRRLTDVPFNLLAEWDGAPAGITSGLPGEDSGTVELISMWVAPFARGRGVGDALVDAVLGWARKRGARRVTLTVRQDNHPAAALYRRRGFVDGELVTGQDGVAEREMTRLLG